MGIRGLTTFVDAHPELLTDFHLHDTPIIIDGNNLYHFLYYHFHVACEYGGDYDQFARSCETFFAALRSCNVIPYVVFDGAYASDGHKFQTSLARARERVHMSNIVAHGRHAKLLPVLTHSCFVRVLQRLDVAYVTCDFEADRQIAALARHWNCPVLTNDSDFFVYDIPAGVVLLDYLNLRCRCQHRHPKQNLEVVYRYLDAQVFYCQKLMKYLRVDNHSFIVLFATLLGNDIIDGRNFDNFFSHVKLPKTHSRSKSSHMECKIAGLAAWLQSVNSVRDAVTYILAKLPQDRRKSVESLMELSLECYSEPLSDLHEYFDGNPEWTKRVGRTFGECVLPEWFQSSVCRGTIPTVVLNVLASRRVILMSQIELSTELSSYRCSQKLRQVAYAIALSVNSSTPDCHAAQVSEFDRECRTLRMYAVDPISQLNGKRLPCLIEVSQIDRRHRFLLLLEALDTGVDHVFDLLIPDIQFLVAVLRCWVRHATAKISTLHIHALLLCFFKLGALDTYLLVAPKFRPSSQAVRHASWLLQMKKSQVSVISDITVTEDENSDLLAYILQALEEDFHHTSSDDQKDTLSQENDTCELEINKVKEKLVQFDSLPHHNHAVTFNAAVVYAFAEFHTCFLSAACIASVLGLTVYDPGKVFSGTVLYNLMRQLKSCSNPDMYVTELLGGSSSLPSTCYFQMMNAVLSDIPEGRLEVHGYHQKKKSKRTKKDSSKAAMEMCDESNSMSQAEQTADGGADSYVLNCDIDNRFSNLSLVEE